MTRLNGQPLSDLERRQRLNLARQCVAEGVTGSEFARRCGISRAAAHHWLTRFHHEDILRALASGRRNTAMSEDASDRRARLLAECALGWRRQKDVARLEGVSDAAISQWKAANWIAVEDALYELRRAA